MDVVAAGRDVVAAEVRREQLRHLVGIEGGRGTLHGLRPPGGARGVLHELAREAVGRARRRLIGEQRVERGEARHRAYGDAPRRGRHRAYGDAPRRRHAGLLRRGRRDLRVARMRDEGARARVGKDPGHLTRGERGVDGHPVPARLHHGEQHRDERLAVREQHRHRVAVPEPARAERVHERVAARRERARGPDAPIGLDQRGAIRLLLRAQPEAVSHQR